MKKILGFPQNVFILSFISFLNDIGGETIKKTIPLFLTNVLGVRLGIVGVVEGVADATPQLLQPLSGYIADAFRKRKHLVVIGQILRSSMVLLFWATTWPQILLLRFLDRSGKGIATAPRDALLSGSSETGRVGRAFGLSRMFDNAGAVVGLLLASLILIFSREGGIALTRTTFQSIVLLSAVPLFFAVVLLIFFIHDVTVPVKRQPLTISDRLGKKYYVFLVVSFFFTLGNSSDAFLILKSQAVGMAVWHIFLLMAGYSLVAALSGLPLSSLSDRIGRKRLLLSGWALYSGVYFLLGITHTVFPMALLTLIYGLYYGLTEGSAKALVSDLVPAQRHATAFGIYNMVIGLTLFLASALAGLLWQTLGPAATFFFGSAMALVAAVALWLFL